MLQPSMGSCQSGPTRLTEQDRHRRSGHSPAPRWTAINVTEVTGLLAHFPEAGVGIDKVLGAGTKTSPPAPHPQPPWRLMGWVTQVSTSRSASSRSRNVSFGTAQHAAPHPPADRYRESVPTLAAS